MTVELDVKAKMFFEYDQEKIVFGHKEPASVCNPVIVVWIDDQEFEIEATAYGLQQALIGHLQKKREEAEVSKRRDDY